VRDQHSFWLAGGARRKDNLHKIVFVDADRRDLTPRGGPFKVTETTNKRWPFLGGQMNFFSEKKHSGIDDLLNAVQKTG
jgi:hypothetical protein